MLKRSPILNSSTQSWVKTLRLPHSQLPPRPDPTLRPQFIKSCSDDLYAWQAKTRPAGNPFILHDGPPYANGQLHVGHALNKILKDIFNRFQLSQNKRVHYLPGWDCHGLPIELKALQEAGIARGGRDTNAVAIRLAAAKLAAATIEEQKQEFRNWAVMADWENAYKTMDLKFEVEQLEVFRKLVQKGLIYRQRKPVYWSPSSGTALADAELEYNNHHSSLAAYVKFRITKLPDVLKPLHESRPVYALIWTTTPWTLPANRAIAVHADLEYSVLEHQDEYLIACSSRLSDVAAAADMSLENLPVVIDGIKGSQLADGTQYVNELHSSQARPLNVLTADYVSSDSGTGLVHTAPGHGFDDFELGETHNLDAFAPVDDNGLFTGEAFPENPNLLQGKRVLQEGASAILEILRNMSGGSPNSSLIWATHKHHHKYPIDWRTKQPVIIRATAQWFADVNDIKEIALEALDNVNFIPKSGQSRLQNFVKARDSWCISRQRAWGVPIPVLYRLEDGRKEAILNEDSIAHIISAISERGTDAWWVDAEDEPRWISPSLTEGTYVRGKDTMDVWFDSGTTWTQLHEKPHVNRALADMYLEGSDQHRGWFQSSLLTRIAYLVDPRTEPGPRAPYKNLITHGFVLDEKGRKMSKSVGNVIGPEQIMNGTLLPALKVRNKAINGAQVGKPQYDAMGLDALRLWVAKNDYRNDVAVGENVLIGVNAALHKYRVMLKWLLGVLEDYNEMAVAKLGGSLSLSNRLALRHLTKTVIKVHSAYVAHEPFKAMRELERYVAVDLSSFYVETAKDLLYTGTRDDRHRAQYVCCEILQAMLVMLAPVTPLLVAECLHYASPTLLTHIKQQDTEPFKRIWSPDPVFEDKAYLELSLDRQNEVVEALRQAVNSAQEALRQKRMIGSGLECRVELRLSGGNGNNGTNSFLKKTAQTEELAQALIVSEVKVKEVSAITVQANVDDSNTSISKTVNLGSPETCFNCDVIVSRTNAAKCPRCWRYVLPTDHKHSTQTNNERICSRCSDTLEEMKSETDGSILWT